MNEKPASVAPAFVLGVCLAIGLILAGYFVAGAVMESRRSDRTVTVRGLAEQEVAADLAIWALSFRVADNDPSALREQIRSNREQIRNFLTARGFSEEEMTDTPPRTTDTETESYQNQKRQFRYTGSAAVLLQSSDVPRVLTAMEQSDQLIREGVVLEGNRPDFFFTSLNEIKPAMLGEANQNARKAAEKFADDSGSSIGAIRKASQGLFEIRNRDPNSPQTKVVRVVTLVEYFIN